MELVYSRFDQYWEITDEALLFMKNLGHEEASRAYDDGRRIVKVNLVNEKNDLEGTVNLAPHDPILIEAAREFEVVDSKGEVSIHDEDMDTDEYSFIRGGFIIPIFPIKDKSDQFYNNFIYKRSI